MPKPKKQLTYFIFLLIFVAILVTVIYVLISLFLKYKPSVNIVTPSKPPISKQINYVIDGDTIKLSDGAKVRYIGINTPEKDECYGYEATQENTRLVENTPVKLVKDTSETDKYGRLLRYVYIDNCTEYVDTKYCEADNTLFVNRYLIEAGYATLMQIPPDTKHYEEFKGLENKAKEKKLGLWKECRR